MGATLNLVEYPELVEDYNGIGRHYTTPSGVRYPSVTTVLGQMPKDGLDEWRERVGEEKAERIMKASAKVGSEFHDACEQHVLGNDPGVLTHGAQMLFASARRELKKIDNVRGIEIPMWSDYLKIAGRSDCIGDYAYVPSIIDYKNSRSPKPLHFCTSYFLQGAAYARMFYERHGIVIKQMVIIIAVWGQLKPTVHIEKVRDWVKPLDQVMMDHNPLWN